MINSVNAKMLSDSLKDVEVPAMKFSASAGYSTTGGSDALSFFLGNIMSAVISILGVLFLAMALFGGYKYMMARGNEEKVDEGVSTIRQAIFGLVITVGAFAIWKFISGYLLK